MARLEFSEPGFSAAGVSATQADMLFQLGMMHANGRDCVIDLVAAHKWLNIAAIKGSPEAATQRARLSARMSKRELASALRQAREWMMGD